MLRRRPLTSVVLALALSACRGAPDAMTVALSPDPAYTTDDLALVDRFIGSFALLTPSRKPIVDQMPL